MPRMNRARSTALLALLLVAASACSAEGGDAAAERLAELRAVMTHLRPLHRRLGKPGPHDWLAHHHEPGQTFDQYVRCGPVMPRGKRRVIYIQPIGDFTKTQRRIVDLTVRFMSLYFDRPVQIRPALSLDVIPASARRVHPAWKVKQVLTGHVLNKVLKPRLPEDAAAYIAFTTSDLWPGEGWNFVYGEASLRERVGVWSIHRNGDPEESEAAFRLCLLRTMKTATHETGHMFSMYHCTLFECNMCGCNNRAESDRRPIALCPECLAKVCWATGADPLQRYKNLSAFCREAGLPKEREFYDRCIAVLRANRPR